MKDKAAINVSELAAQLGISKPKAYELTKRNDFPAISLGKRIIIPTAALHTWLMNNSMKTNSN